MRKIMKKALGFTLAALMTLSLAACSSAGGGATGESAAGQSSTAAEESTPAEQSTAAENAAAVSSGSGEKIVNVGVTDTLTSLNPLLLNGGEVNKYATGLMFLPLMELDADLNFVPMVADSITTEDNLNFIVHIDEEATWSDGTPITADDVAYTALRLASPMVNNTSMMYYVFEGVGDDGFVEEGAESIEGVQVIDEKTVQFTTKEPLSLIHICGSPGTPVCVYRCGACCFHQEAVLAPLWPDRCRTRYSFYRNGDDEQFHDAPQGVGGICQSDDQVYKSGSGNPDGYDFYGYYSVFLRVRGNSAGTGGRGTDRP